MINLTDMGRAARAASRTLASLTTARKDEALAAIAAELTAQAPAILTANAEDIADARAAGLSEALIDRLLLTEARLEKLAAAVRHVASLPDPVGTEIMGRVLPNGLRLSKRRIPIGVIGAIYEARPNVTIDIAALCLKTGNACILRGGSETFRSNMALVTVIGAALERCALPPAAAQAIADPDRRYVAELLTLSDHVDMIIPRGGAGLHRFCKENSRIPVMTGGIGICHVFVDESADLERAVEIVENAKVQRPSVCNALDTVLVHEAVATQFLPAMAARLARHDVELRAEGDALSILRVDGHDARVVPAGPDDFDQEWLALILGVRIVPGLDAALDHIATHGTHHSDAILTQHLGHAERFVQEVDSAAVYVNASTRFTDGGEFGLGAEVAVSTEKLHARGPMGLEELTSYKWVGIGDGHIRA